MLDDIDACRLGLGNGGRKIAVDRLRMVDYVDLFDLYEIEFLGILLCKVVYQL